MKLFSFRIRAISVLTFEAGMSTRGWTISEVDAGELEFHLVDRDL